MKEDQIKGFVRDERGDLRINHEDVSALKRIFRFLYQNVHTLPELKLVSEIICTNLETVAIEEGRKIDNRMDEYIFGIDVFGPAIDLYK